MKKSIVEMLKVFGTNPIEAEKAYHEKNRRWYLSDRRLFWEKAMAAYPEDNLTATAYRLIEYLNDNDLIDYTCIGWDFLNFVDEYDGDCDTSLKAFTIEYIADYFDWWLDTKKDSETAELRKAIDEAKTVWYWDELLTYCVKCLDYEHLFVKKVAQATKN